ncbi:glycosyltransferase family 4 protein [Infirmifilum sp. NZ]|uniref:glycosyltransferase family 4 protein n=1 Tax=Infirmifilum sp. NZ TaxID=2926850 RepID=UPI00279C93EE|nr:glycosyltransferase family 4 protein [Infirmifilum sp. NZ]UNQ73157.1 glycosyltransferase family 4 protein [Infirmifilum sp. NZ]
MNDDLKFVKIVVVTPFPFIATEIGNKLARRGLSVLVITSSKIKEYKEAEFEKEVRVIFLGRNMMLDLVKALVALFSFKPHIILMYSGGGVLGLLMFPLVRICQIFYGVYTVSYVMEPIPRIGIKNPLIAWIETVLEVKFANLIITDAEKLKRLLLRFHKISPSKVAVFTNEWDAPYFYRYKVKEEGEKKWILFFGTVQEYKGLEYLIRAEPLITEKYPEVKIVIAGSGQEKYYSMIRDRSKYILLNKFISYKLGACLFQKSMIIVLPYTMGTVSGIIPVAYAFKKPIIATRVGSFDEVIEHGKTGILIPPQNPKALAEAVIMLLENTEMRKKLGEAGFSKLKSEMSWDVFIDKFMKTVLKTWKSSS